MVQSTPSSNFLFTDSNDSDNLKESIEVVRKTETAFVLSSARYAEIESVIRATAYELLKQPYLKYQLPKYLKSALCNRTEQ